MGANSIIGKASADYRVMPGLPKPVTTWTVLKASIIKDLKIAISYRVGLFGGIIELLVRMLFFLTFASVITFEADLLGRPMTTTDIFVFFQASLVLWIFRAAALHTPLETVDRDLYFGTLEYLYTNPCSRYAYYVGSILSSILLSTVVFVPLYLILIYVSKANITNMIMVLLVCLVSFITLTALGVMIAGAALLWRNVGSIAGLVNLAFEFLAGAFFPISAFPQFIQYISYLVPFTWGYDLVRYYSFNREWQTILPVWQEWLILSLSGVFFAVLSYYLLKKVERLAKKKGLNLL